MLSHEKTKLKTIALNLTSITLLVYEMTDTANVYPSASENDPQIKALFSPVCVTAAKKKNCSAVSFLGNHHEFQLLSDCCILSFGLFIGLFILEN